MEPLTPLPTLAASAPSLDSESLEWLRRLRANDSTRQDAIASLHALLMRAARFEVARGRRIYEATRSKTSQPRLLTTR